jgi:hypothetical protein
VAKKGCQPGGVLSGSRGPAITAVACGGIQIDAFQEHGQISGTECMASVARLRAGGQLEDPLLQSLVPQSQTIAIPVEDLEPFSGAIAENEQMTTEGIELQMLDNQSTQTIETATAIDGLSTEENAHGRREG